MKLIVALFGDILVINLSLKNILYYKVQVIFTQVLVFDVSL